MADVLAEGLGALAAAAPHVLRTIRLCPNLFESVRIFWPLLGPASFRSVLFDSDRHCSIPLGYVQSRSGMFDSARRCSISQVSVTTVRSGEGDREVASSGGGEAGAAGGRKQLQGDGAGGERLRQRQRSGAPVAD